jgi:hypothetical protein
MSATTRRIDPRNPFRQRHAAHLHRCGPRCILEALIAVDRGESLDAVLADFGRFAPEVYHAANSPQLVGSELAAQKFVRQVWYITSSTRLRTPFAPSWCQWKRR